MVEQRQKAVSRMVGPAGRRPAAGDAVLTPKDIFGILRRHILLMVSMTILGLLIGGAVWYLFLTYFPKYTARTYLRILAPVEKDPMTIVTPQVQKDILYGHRATIAALIMQQSNLQDLIDRDKIRQTKWFHRFGDVETEMHECIRKAFKDLMGRFRAVPDRDREFVVLSMTCGDKEESALIVNEMAGMFVASQGIESTGAVVKKLASLRSQQDSVQGELYAAEASLNEVRGRWEGITDLEPRAGRYFQHTITLRLNDLELEQNRLLLQTRQIQALIGTLGSLAEGPIQVQTEYQIETDPVMMMLAQQLALQESEIAGRRTRFGENHRVVRRAQELINEIRERREIRKAEIAELTRLSNLRDAQDMLVVLMDRLEELNALRDEAITKQKELDAARNLYEQRLMIRDERKAMLDSIKEQVGKLQIMHLDPETPKVQRWGYAPVPLEVSSPRWGFYLPGGTMLGLLFGIGLTFLVELLNDLVRTPRDVGRYLHIPLLGVIPDADEDVQIGDADLRHVVRQAPYSITSESYRRFRTNLKLSGAAESLKVLLVSSGMAGDGTTSVAVNLAATLIAEDKKVLLIDANFRRPSLQTVFPKAEAGESGAEHPELGLSALLTGQCSYEEAKRSNVIEGLDIIDSGPLPPNPAELLGNPQMERLINDQRNSYDYIIIDTPPVLLVSDAKVLGRFVDGTVLVFNAGTTRRGAAQRAIRELKETDAIIVGCVLFAVRAMKGGYFREQFKSYQKYQKLQLAHST